MERRIEVLIVDDRSRSRAGLRALLSTWPELEVVAEAADGWQAVRLVEEHRPDLVLMDIQMPVMDGLEATRIIKGRWPEVKIVALSMYAYNRANVLAAGADAFVSKADPPERLLATIDKCWEKRLEAV